LLLGQTTSAASGFTIGKQQANADRLFLQLTLPFVTKFNTITCSQGSGTKTRRQRNLRFVVDKVYISEWPSLADVAVVGLPHGKWSKSQKAGGDS
jgi:hypothetical protein